MFEKLKKKALGLGAVDFGRSAQKNKKYFVILRDGTRVDFGHPEYDDYTVHRDLERRHRYLARARMDIRDIDGQLTRNNIKSPNYWSIKLLWDG